MPSEGYYVHAHESMIGKEMTFKEFPQVKLIYLGYRNDLSPVLYDYSISRTKDIPDGDLEIDFDFNGTKITINNADYIRKQSINVDGHRFQGLEFVVQDLRRDKTYLRFRIMT